MRTAGEFVRAAEAVALDGLASDYGKMRPTRLRQDGSRFVMVELTRYPKSKTR
jgi:hypothetical protein